MSRRPPTLAEAAAVFRDAFHSDPGTSDLDSEQPLTIRVSLGAWRALDYALRSPQVVLDMKERELIARNAYNSAIYEAAQAVRDLMDTDDDDYTPTPQDMLP